MAEFIIIISQFQYKQAWLDIRGILTTKDQNGSLQKLKKLFNWYFAQNEWIVGVEIDQLLRCDPTDERRSWWMKVEPLTTYSSSYPSSSGSPVFGSQSFTTNFNVQLKVAVTTNKTKLFYNPWLQMIYLGTGYIQYDVNACMHVCMNTFLPYSMMWIHACKHSMQHDVNPCMHAFHAAGYESMHAFHAV